jgi:hypothetical protein
MTDLPPPVEIQRIREDAIREAIGLDKSARINLGIDLLHALRKPGARFTREEIAAWCDCSEEAIENIERKALEKLRRALRKAGVGRETLRALVPDHRRDAVAKSRVESV